MNTPAMKHVDSGGALEPLFQNRRVLSRILLVLVGVIIGEGLYVSHAQAQTTLTSTETPSLEEQNEGWISVEEDADAREESTDSLFRRNPIFIEGIEILGNDKTEASVILRRILVRVGDLIDDDLLEESRLRLLNSGFFEAVEFSLKRGSKRGRALLVVELLERNTILVDEFYLGFSSIVPIYSGLGVAETNFLGRGVTVRGGFVGGEDRRALDLGLFVPNLGNTRLQLLSSLIALEGAELVEDQNPDAAQLKYKRFGGTLGLGFSAGAAQRIALVYRLESIDVDRLPNLSPRVLRGAPSIQFDDSVLSSVSLSYERDTRDDPFVATQGSRTALSVEVGSTLLGSSYEYSKYTAEIEMAFLAFKKHSLLLHLAGGMVQGQTPFFNQFFVSDYSYFSFGRDALPRAAELNFSESNDYDDLIISAGADYSIPIQRGHIPLYRTYVYGAIDVSVTASLDELQEDPTGRGVGDRIPVTFDAGVKFDTWIGNFKFSISYVLDLVF